MPGKNAIRLEGQVVGILKESVLFAVELVNGHQILGHVSGLYRRDGAGIRTGDRVNLEMSPFDFSKGRIVLEEKQNESSRIS